MQTLMSKCAATSGFGSTCVIGVDLVQKGFKIMPKWDCDDYI
jgi:hypothetical protein